MFQLLIAILQEESVFKTTSKETVNVLTVLKTTFQRG